MARTSVVVSDPADHPPRSLPPVSVRFTVATEALARAVSPEDVGRILALHKPEAEGWTVIEDTGPTTTADGWTRTVYAVENDGEGTGVYEVRARAGWCPSSVRGPAFDLALDASRGPVYLSGAWLSALQTAVGATGGAVVMRAADEEGAALADLVWRPVVYPSRGA